MTTFARISGVLLTAFLTSGIAHAETMQLTFKEQDRGIEPYPVRMLVNDDFLRIDDGGDGNTGFLLLRRADGMLFSVVPDDHTVLEIPRSEIPAKPPIPVNPEEEFTPDPKAPKVGGKPMLHFRQHFADKTCFSAVVADDLLPKVRTALMELNQTLAGQQMKTIGNFPPESLTPCLLARLVYARQTFLSRGMPMAEWDENGYRRELMDYRVVDDLPGDVFKLPDGYEHYQIGKGLPM